MANSKNYKRETSFVTLRTKSIAKGRKSFYLDIYKDGKRYYEFLKLYLLPGNDVTTKTQNRNARQAALAIRNQRELDIIQGKGGIKNELANSRILLIDWLNVFKEQKEKTGQSNKRAQTVEELILHIKAYKGGESILLGNVDESFCKGLISYLSKAPMGRNKGNNRIAKSTANLYFSVFTSALNEAVRKKLLYTNPIHNLSREDKKPIKAEKSHRPYLTIEEVKQLIKTECSNIDVKRAFLFACFTGLRVSDIINLTWDKITNTGGNYYVSIVVQKTKEPLIIKLNGQALKWLPEKGKGCVFSLPTYSITLNRILKNWAKSAGIEKNICFHVSRHTFATMELTLGADLYVVSKLLGHANVGTTQIYADIINKKREEAVEMIDKAF